MLGDNKNKFNLAVVRDKGGGRDRVQRLIEKVLNRCSDHMQCSKSVITYSIRMPVITYSIISGIHMQ